MQHIINNKMEECETEESDFNCLIHNKKILMRYNFFYTMEFRVIVNYLKPRALPHSQMI